jgi:hypothetical protein
MPTYRIDLVGRSGAVHHHTYTDDDGLHPGSVIRVEGRDLLVARIEPAGEGGIERVVAAPARYQLLLRHGNGREEPGAMRRFRPDRPTLGHAFTTIEEGHPVSWHVTDERLAQDEHGEPYLELIAARDYGEYDQPPDHELEHALAQRDGLPEDAATVLERASGAGLAVELVALEPGEQPDWDEAERYIDALVLEEVETDLLELCGVDFRHPRETWLATAKERLGADLRALRNDIEGQRDQIAQWEFADGRVFASVGSEEQEADPSSGHGWMCRLVDSGALGAAGFARVRRTELWPA